MAALATAGYGIYEARSARSRLETLEKESMRHREVSGFLSDLLFAIPPKAPEGHNETMRRLVSAGCVRARREYADSPETLVAVLTALGNASNGLSDFHGALNIFQEALALQDARLPPGTAARGRLLDKISLTNYNLSNYEAALRYARDAARALRTVQPPAPLDLASALSGLGQAYDILGRFRDGEGPLREAVELYRKHGSDEGGYLDTLRAYGVNLNSQGRWEEGLPLLREATSRFLAKNGDTSSDYLRTLNDLGNALALSGKLAEAAARQSDLIDAVSTVMGPDNPNTAICHLNLASTLIRLNDLNRAERELQAGRRIFDRTLGTVHPRFGEFLRAEGRLRSLQGRTGEAFALLSQALAHERKTLPEGSLNEGFTLSALAQAQALSGDKAHAQTTARQALDILRPRLQPAHPEIAALVPLAR